MVFEEYNFHGIYRTPLEQAMRRPTYEPPDIDITGIFETPHNSDVLQHIEERIPDPVIRCDFLDFWSENAALIEYHDWVFECGRAAIFGGDREKEKFYEDLINTILVDTFVVWDEYKVKYGDFGAKLGRLPFDGYRNEAFKFRDENGVPLEFHVVVRGEVQSQSSGSRLSATQVLTGGLQIPDTNDQHSTSHGESDRGSNNDASNNESNVPATPPRSKSSKDCCIIL